MPAMYDYHIVLAAVASVLGVVSLIPYYRDIFRGTTKPHVFSWFIWSLINALVFFIQLADQAGWGAWVSGAEVLCCASVAILAFSRGEKNITWHDWVCFIVGLVALGFWLLAKAPLTAVLFIMAADLLAYAPTYRKSYSKPSEETAIQYALSALRWFITLFALQVITPVDVLVPLQSTILDTAMVVLLLVRRKQILSATR